MITEDVPVKYINYTNKTNFQVVVFAKNSSCLVPSTKYVAWQVLKVQGSVQFKFPVDVEIGASYVTGGMTITAGPIQAELGSTWSIKQEYMHDSAILTEDTTVPPNQNGAIFIKNIRPRAWFGRKFDVGVYREKRLFLVQKDIRVNDHVEFVLEPKLCFGISYNVKVEQVFDSLQMMNYVTEYDLREYPNGIQVSLHEKPGGGEYEFIAEQLM